VQKDLAERVGLLLGLIDDLQLFHLSFIVTIMKLSKTPDDIKRNVNAIPLKFGDTMEMDFNAPS
jgi:hypothetical protein